LNDFFGTGLFTATYSTPQIRVWLDTSYVGTYSETSINTAKYLTGTISAESSLARNDLAVIHVSMDDTPSIALGDSNGVSPTDNLTIIGYPSNGDDNHLDTPRPNDFFDESINQIYVSAIKTNDNGATVIQVGGNVEHGDSGGPALNAQGQIVGVVSFGGLDDPDGTSFLQAESSAAPLVSQANVDATPGKFQRSWRQALTDFASTASGHWHSAASELQTLQQNYPQFNGVTSYLTFAQQKARTENSNGVASFFGLQNPTFWIGAVLIVAAIVILIIAISVVSRSARRLNNQTQNVTEPALVASAVAAAPMAQPAYSQPYNYYPYTPPSAPPAMADVAPQQVPSQPPPSYWGSAPESPVPPTTTRPATCVNGHAMQPYEVYCATCGAPRAQG
ncbi:MAG TPA: serine protease, partial [Ktedonobacterales bacterium]|nr:serine protease [Ktedonobacterales bacterium]